MDIFTTNWIEQLDIALKVLIATLLGGLVGFEREMMHKPAGLRTHAILAASAALLVGIADSLVGHFVTEQSPELLRVDPLRVVEAIVTGVAFLGAGTIFRNQGGNGRDAVEGLTTAASFLLVAAIGVTVAVGHLLLAVVITLLALVLLYAVRKVEP